MTDDTPIPLNWVSITVRIPAVTATGAQTLAASYRVPLDRIVSHALSIVIDYAADARAQGVDPFPNLHPGAPPPGTPA